MALLIGMDEAGYGPNLGPLVIAATIWSIPSSLPSVSLWEVFEEVLTPTPCRRTGDRRLHLTDSKQVYQSGGSLRELERTVLAACQLTGLPAENYHTLVRHLQKESLLQKEKNDADYPEVLLSEEQRRPLEEADPSLAGTSLPLPRCTESLEGLDETLALWKTRCEQNGIALRSLTCDVIWPQRWNRLLQHFGRKSDVLTRLSLQLLRRFWKPGANEPTRIVADKHGARNRYGPFLQEMAGDEPVLCVRESSVCSQYRVGESEISFRSKGEAELPVALASMTAKYVRELSMELFNRFWAKHVPGLQPTKGYPQDAKRFRADIAEAQQRLALEDRMVWRER